MPQFKVGDHAVYPGHGVGRIDKIEFKEILGSKHEFYSVVIIESGMRVMIPAANIKSVGLRHLINKEEGLQVVEILKDKNVKIDTQTWNRRYREYMEKIKTGSVVEIAAVLRDLYMLKVDKELSFGEKKMLETAKTLLMKELDLAPEVKEIVNQSQEVKDIFNQ
jgi:CarD family transcriptional regulator